MATFLLKLVNDYGTFNLHTANGIIIQSFEETHTARNNLIVIPRRDGGFLDTPLLREPKIITMNGIIKGTTQETYRTYKDAFIKNIEDEDQYLYKFDDRFLTVNKIDMNIRDNITDLMGFFDLMWLAKTPYWISDVMSTNTFTTSALSYDMVVTTVGTAPSPPVITITAASNFTNATMRITIGGVYYTASHTGAGKAWIIDCEDMTATMDAANSLSLFSGDFWYLQPGSNTIRFTQSGAVAVTIKIEWYDRWF